MARTVPDSASGRRVGCPRTEPNLPWPAQTSSPPRPPPPCAAALGGRPPGGGRAGAPALRDPWVVPRPPADPARGAARAPDRVSARVEAEVLPAIPNTLSA